MAAQDTLQKLWLHGKAGGMAAREQLKAWALREAWLDGGIATACPRPACGPGWQAGQVSERGVDPVLSWPARGRAHRREMMPFENKRIFRTCLTQTGAKITLILVSQCGGFLGGDDGGGGG